MSWWPAVWTELPTGIIVPELRRALAESQPAAAESEPDAGSHVGQPKTIRQFPRSAFALVAMLLAAAGLYGSLPHSVERCQRVNSGVCMALSADRAGVLRMVLSQGMRLSMAGPSA